MEGRLLRQDHPAPRRVPEMFLGKIFIFSRFFYENELFFVNFVFF